MSAKTSSPTVGEIVRRALVAGDYAGLYNVDGECACTLDELAPCGEMNEDCVAGDYMKGCVDTCGNGCDWHIVPRKKEK